VPVLTRLALFTLASFALVAPACAEEIVAFGERFALYNSPASRPAIGLILLPGGGGDIGISQSGAVKRKRNWIVRTRADYAKAAIASLLLDDGIELADAFVFLRQRADKVVVVAQGRGSLTMGGRARARGMDRRRVRTQRAALRRQSSSRLHWARGRGRCRHLALCERAVEGRDQRNKASASIMPQTTIPLANKNIRWQMTSTIRVSAALQAGTQSAATATTRSRAET